MSKIKIKVAFLGHPLFSIDTKRVRKWKSEYWELVPSFNTHPISSDSDGNDWSYSKDNIKEIAPPCDDADVLILITSVCIEDRYIAKVFDKNKVCLTFFKLTKDLDYNNIPHENLLLKQIYSVVIRYMFTDKNLQPNLDSEYFLSHDETRQCLFDMCGNRGDVVHSLHKPHICSACSEKLTNRGSRIGKNVIDSINEELKNIKKRRFYIMADWIKLHPILTICLSSLLALFLGMLGSLFASFIWKFLFRFDC